MTAGRSATECSSPSSTRSGIPRGAEEQLFAPFQRLGDHDTSIGVGLGLSVARGFVEAMGGTISATDTPGGGPRSNRFGGGMTTKTRVLVIDDEPQILRALRINLSVRGYEVFTAASGTEALKQAADHKPDVIVLDLGLPDMSGIDVLAGCAAG